MYRIVYVLLIAILVTPLASMVGSGSNGSPPPYAYLEIVIGGNITNAGSKPVPINETDLLVYDYPFNTSSQKVLSTTLYLEGRVIGYRIEADEEGNNLLIGNASEAGLEYIGVNQTVSSRVVYKVYVDMGRRMEEIKGISLENAGGWSDIVVEDDILIEETGLWNYSNPLVKLLIKYIMSKHNQSPLDYLLGVLDWVDNNVAYAVRVPARHPWEVIAYRQGDCDDQSNLVITLLRGVGIPAYLEIGFVYLDRSLEHMGRPGYNETIEAANGMVKYHFIGGGAHGWMVAYIPPWGYVRIDLTFAKGGLRHIKLAAYYGLNNYVPTIVFSVVKKKDYVESSAEFIEEVQEKKLLYNIYICMRETNGP